MAQVKITRDAGSCLRLSEEGALITSAMVQMITDLVKAAVALVPEETSAHTFAHNSSAQYPSDVVGLARLLGLSSLDTTRSYSQPEVSQLAKRIEQFPLNAYSG